jgi:hydroxyacylglutathione hydrolase
MSFKGYKVIPVTPLRVNSTILYSQGEAFIFDPGGDVELIVDFLRRKRLFPKGIFLTHGHVDHFGGVKKLKNLLGKDIPVYIHKKDQFLLSDELWSGFANYLGADLNPPVDGYLNEGDKFKVGSFEVEVYETPGHTPGSVVFYVPQMELLIAGDLLFKGGVGRWDLPGGDLEELKKSLKRVFKIFPDTTRVITGHYELTTIGYEREHNPFLVELGI